MLGIIFVLISIALFIGFLLMGSNVINIDAIRRSGLEKEIRVNMATVDAALQNYKTAQRQFPTGGSWQDSVFPEYGRQPVFSFNYSLSLEVVSGTRYLCLSADADKNTKEAFINLETKMPTQYKKGLSCGVSEIIDAENETVVLSYSI